MNNEAAGKERARNITRGIGSLTLQNVATSILGFAFVSGLIRLLPLVQYGAYSAVSSSVTVAVSISTLGLQYASARFVAADDGATRWASARATVRLVLFFSIIVSVAFSGISPYLSMYFMKSTQYTWVFLLGGLWILASSVHGVMLGILQGLKMYSLIAKMLLIARFVMVALALGLIFFYRNVEIAVIAWVAFYCALILWAYRITRSIRVKSESRAPYSSILRYSVPLGFAVLMTMVASSSQIFVIGGYLDPASLGVFNSAVTITSVLGLVLVIPLITTLFPEIASSSNQRDQVSQGLRLAFRFLFLAVLPTSLFVGAVSGELLTLFTGGGSYLAGSSSLEIIAVFYLFPAAQLVVYSVLQALGRTNDVLIVGGAAAITGVFASLILVPYFGIEGAALSTILVGLVGSTVAMYLARMYLNHVLDRSSLYFYFKSVVASSLPFFAIYVLELLRPGLLTLIPYVAIWVASYAILLKSLRILTDEDRAHLEHLLPGRAKRILSHI